MQVHLYPAPDGRSCAVARWHHLKGAALQALGDSHEHTARKFLRRIDFMWQTHLNSRSSNLRDELGYQHLKQPTGKGLPVWPAELSAHFG
jgi:hypothetical protein